MWKVLDPHRVLLRTSPEHHRRRSSHDNGENKESERRRAGPWLWPHLKEKMSEDQDEGVQLGSADASVWLLSVEDNENTPGSDVEDSETYGDEAEWNESPKVHFTVMLLIQQLF